MAALVLGLGLGWSVPLDPRPAGEIAAERLSEPARLTIASDGAELRFEGEFSDGTARRLRRHLRTHPDIRVLSLASEGGLVDEADQVGDIVAAYGLVTLVRDSCVSACTLAFVRGRERLAHAGAKLGFHAPWEPGPGGSEVQVASDDEREAYLAAGVAAYFTRDALAVPSRDIWFPDSARLARAGVVDAFVTETELAARIATLPRAPARATASAGP